MSSSGIGSLVWSICPPRPDAGTRMEFTYTYEDKRQTCFNHVENFELTSVLTSMSDGSTG